MQVKCHVMSHTDDRTNFRRVPKIRMVTVPDGTINPTNVNDVLNAAFYWGQNDFAVGPEKNTTYSLSVADVISFGGKLYLIKSVGFEQITGERFKRIRQMARRDRWLIDMRKQRRW